MTQRFSLHFVRYINHMQSVNRPQECGSKIIDLMLDIAISLCSPTSSQSTRLLQRSLTVSFFFALFFRKPEFVLTAFTAQFARGDEVPSVQVLLQLSSQLPRVEQGFWICVQRGTPL